MSFSLRVDPDTGDFYVLDGGSSTKFGTGGATHVAEVGVASSRGNRYETTIGYAANLTGYVEFAQVEDIRAYRLYPSAQMRYIEDAPNVTQANILLNSAAAQTATVDVPVDYGVAHATEWTEWIELDKDQSIQSLSALWFGLDAAGTGATVIVEAR